MRKLELKRVDGSGHIDLPFEFKLASDEAKDGTIEGYGAVFGLTDLGGDIIEPGAFKKSLSEWRKRKKLPPMLWQHSSDYPIGVWDEIAEDDKGLKVAGHLILEVPQAATAYALVKNGALSGLSIGYRTVEAKIDRTTGARRLERVDIWEVSIVTFPMMPEAQIASVKDFDPRAMEDALRDAGLSHRDRKAAVAVFRKSLQRDAGEPGRPLREGARDLLMMMRKATESLRA